MRLKKSEMKKWLTWLADYAPVCQACNKQQAVEAHHLYYGAYKNDTLLISVCRDCHNWCHANKKISQKRFDKTVKTNWEKYKEMK